MNSFMERANNAAKALRELFAPTPLQLNDFLSRRYGAKVYLKREDLSPVRSYKIRGAFNFFRKALAQEGGISQLFVCASAGNHAQGFAFVCRHFGVKGVVFMPVTTPQQKIEKTRMFGGGQVEIRLVGDFFDDCYAAAISFCSEKSGIMVPPFDHKDIIEGQATVGVEIIDQLRVKAADLVLVPVGGGGLAAGVTRFFDEACPNTRFVFCEPTGAPSLHVSLSQGRRVKLAKIDNFVDGAAVAEIGRENLRLLQRYAADDVKLVPEGRLCATMIEMLNIEGVVLEPAGALAIDALKDIPRKELKNKTVVCVVSGGNFDFERLPDVKERALRYEGLKKYFVFRFPQRPGALRSFLDLLGPDDDIARFEYLKKSARNFGSVLIGIETKDRRNFDILTKNFRDAGWAYEDITDNEMLANFII
jgi:threonine dehydratase